MSEENNQNEEVNGSLKRHRENAMHLEVREEKRQAIIKRLKTDPDIQAYFQQFSKDSVDRFIESYAFDIELTMEQSSIYGDVYEKENTRYLERAENCLVEIQLKKLFDQRRLWGANCITIEGVEVSFDFHIIAHDIMNYAALPPITLEEFKLYHRYAKSNHFRYDDFRPCWMGLENTFHGYGEELPAWFDFADLYSGNKVYSELPDLRHATERAYFDLGSQAASQEMKVKQDSGELPAYRPDMRPCIESHSSEDMLYFMHQFEEPEMVRKFQVMCNHGVFSLSNEEGEEDISGEDDPEWLKEQVESIMFTLSTMKDFVLPVESNSDWRLALIRAWEKYERQQTIDALPSAYDQYLFRRENKIAMPVYGRPSDIEMAQGFKNYILRGRKIKGEPEDFNF